MASSPATLSPTELAGALRSRFGDDLLEADAALGDAVVRIGPDRYRELIETLRDDRELAFDYLDFVSAVDWGDRGFDLVVQLWSTVHHHRVRVKLACAPDDPVAPTISDLYPGANWHERETWELLGVRFEGHPQLVKLLLPEQFDGHPLRKDFKLLSREAKPWPGEEKAD